MDGIIDGWKHSKPLCQRFFFFLQIRAAKGLCINHYEIDPRVPFYKEPSVASRTSRYKSYLQPVVEGIITTCMYEPSSLFPPILFYGPTPS